MDIDHKEDEVYYIELQLSPEAANGRIFLFFALALCYSH